MSQGTFIVYACPVGALHDQVAAYFLAAHKAFGPNPAHALSFAYGFAPEHGPGLARLARAMIDPAASALWALRLYERRADHSWALHAAWALA